VNELKKVNEVNEVKDECAVKQVCEVLAAMAGVVSTRVRPLVDARRPAWNRCPEYLAPI
jgi:hypothetical protein